MLTPLLSPGSCLAAQTQGWGEKEGPLYFFNFEEDNPRQEKMRLKGKALLRQMGQTRCDSSPPSRLK